jgi:hypothetical protein
MLASVFATFAATLSLVIEAPVGRAARASTNTLIRSDLRALSFEVHGKHKQGMQRLRLGNRARGPAT